MGDVSLLQRHAASVVSTDVSSYSNTARKTGFNQRVSSRVMSALCSNQKS